MPLLPSRSKQSVPANPDDWRPQRFGRGIRSVKDPLIEPSWGGVRVLARLELGRIRFFDEEGVECTDEFAPVDQVLAAAARGDEMILDGFLTIEPTQSTLGASPAVPEAPGAGRIMTQMLVGQHGAGPPPKKRHLDTDQPIAFVAVDLLRIDNSSLIESPLLERKRILDGALEVGELVRITPFVRPPAGTFGPTWRGLGFEEFAYKGANSRYYPGGHNVEWTIAPIPMAR